MGIEIERKFLVNGTPWHGVAGVVYRQGYLSTTPERTVRVRLAGPQGILTIKGVSTGASRSEYEYLIPVQDAEQLLEQLCLRPLIEKTRYRIEHAGLSWDIDVFSGDNTGLVIAEVELETEQQDIDLPIWIDREVTGDPRFFNASLVRYPYRNGTDSVPGQ